jgi:hypothetical protein
MWLGGRKNRQERDTISPMIIDETTDEARELRPHKHDYGTKSKFGPKARGDSTDK